MNMLQICAVEGASMLYDIPKSEIEMAFARPTPCERRGNIIMLGGYSSPHWIYRYLVHDLKTHGYPSWFPRSIYNEWGFAIPRFPEVFAHLAHEVEEHMAEQTHPIIDYPFHIIGHSMGGFLAIAMKSMFPKRIGKVVCLGTPLSEISVPEFLMDSVKTRTGLDPGHIPDEVVEPIVTILEQNDPQLFSEIMFVSTHGDQIATPETNGLPHILCARGGKPTPITHTGIVFDQETLNIVRSFLEMRVDNPDDGRRLMADMYPKVDFGIDDETAFPHLEQYFDQMYHQPLPS
ncbi:MAG: alpha/beta fold hydrolase [bacterium]|nr:alpha/beta fold hydrolase [bacterium]